ncbi:MAG TPA: hypothetical protein VGI81_26325 [Tepidisphaeraceae bacterium]|jgi:hypothetical protein
MAICISHHSRSLFASFLFVLLGLGLTDAAWAGPVLEVHEWGTFTALQNESGDALPGINIDDEPLPAFCHNLHPWALEPATATRRPVDMKGVPARHPWVTLRLETPVIYFHPPANMPPFSIDVAVQLHGGWLTEFYPHAEPDAPGLKRNEFNFGAITPDTLGSLTWRDVQVGADVRGPQTSEHVWLAPRAVRSAPITVPSQTKKDHGSESEQFLFYRGVGNRPVPLRVGTSVPDHRLRIRGQCADVLKGGQLARIDGMWLVDVRRDGAVAYRALAPITVTADTDSTVATTDAAFAPDEYSVAHLDDLRAIIHRALTDRGLNEDEATAMLETWKRAYFQSPGLRLFFLVPRVWTDAVLPLTISGPAETPVCATDVNRVMMGRIELISPEQRQLLQKLAASSGSNDTGWLGRLGDSAAAQHFREGRSNFGDLGVKIPENYQTYLALGRFRNALVLAEQRVHPTPGLAAFIKAYALYEYHPE